MLRCVHGGSAADGPAVRDLLLISDLHLGSHLKARTRGEFVHLAARIEETFPAFLDHYSREGRWQLVVNGDFIDFWNVEVGGARAEGEAVAVDRLHAVLDAHPAVEDALARFLEAGHGIVFVTGNHDAEFLYPGVRRAMAARLEGALVAEGEGDASITRTGMIRLDEMEARRVRFVPWFVREEGGAWIEHGHVFDPACSTHAQLSPTRGGRLVKSVAEVATRRFANLMPEIDYDAPDKWGLRDYLRWAAGRGLRFLVRVLYLYLRMAGAMIALWARAGRVDKEGREEHERRLRVVAENAGLQMAALTTLQRMAPPPASTTVRGTMRVIALDFVGTALLPFVLVPLLLRPLGVGWAPSLVLAGIFAGLGVRAVARARTPRNVARDMLDVAANVGNVVGCPLVLMGHSHHGSLERLGDVLYGNSGSWLDGSHLVVFRDRSGRLVDAELRRWRNGGVTRLAHAEVPGRGDAVAPNLGGVGPVAAEGSV